MNIVENFVTDKKHNKLSSDFYLPTLSSKFFNLFSITSIAIVFGVSYLDSVNIISISSAIQFSIFFTLFIIMPISLAVIIHNRKKKYGKEVSPEDFEKVRIECINSIPKIHKSSYLNFLIEETERYLNHISSKNSKIINTAFGFATSGLLTIAKFVYNEGTPDQIRNMFIKVVILLAMLIWIRISLLDKYTSLYALVFRKTHKYQHFLESLLLYKHKQFLKN